MRTPIPLRVSFRPSPLPVWWVVAAVVPLLALAPLGGTPPPETAFNGAWKLVEDQSTSVDPWRSLVIGVEVDGAHVTLSRTWGGNREAGTYTDSTTVRTDGSVHVVPMEQWPDNRHLGAFLAGDSTRQVTAQWLDDGRTLQVSSRLQVRTSQGVRPIRIYSEYRLAPTGDQLTLLELRSTRPRPLHYTFERADED